MTRPDVAITIDVDWAPDFMILELAAVLRQAAVPATWMITHSSSALDDLRASPELFEIGIHPNFLPGSSHGRDVREVLAHCFDLVPEAVSVRTHGLVQSTEVLAALSASPLQVDASLFVPHARDVEPVTYWWRGERLVRVPYVWEDDFEFERPHGTWTPDELLAGGGLKVFDFHPVHVHLNSSRLSTYAALRARVPHVPECRPADTGDLVEPGPGTGTMFRDLVAAVAGTGRAAGLHRLATGQERPAAVTAAAQEPAGR